ncbi:MAG: TrkH family potassium uptake protein [Clostridia bacterium]|nr:TrkH family potassium uptake protein [Clostridia bacterium]
MNYRMLLYLLSVILLLEAAFLLAPLLVALIYGNDVIPFLITIGILVVISLPGILQKPKNTKIFAKEGFVTVAASWLLMSAFGALPFFISGWIPNYVNAFFETCSGFTTTGASILTDIEALPQGLLFWRSFTHWIGGMGVLVLMLAIVPQGSHAIYLLRAEIPGPTKGKLVPKLRHTAIILYGIYIVLTLAEVIALCISGLPLYDSLVTTFGTAGTGGFSVLNKSIAGYNNPAAEWIIASFMLIFGINFNIFFFILIGKWREVLKNEEVRLYLSFAAVGVAIVSIQTFRSCAGLEDCLRKSFFQVSSIISTSGFSTVDFDKWPALSKAVLVLLMFTGSCAGSTAGGLKMSRLLIVLKNTIREIRHMLHPRSVNIVRMDGEPVAEETVKSAGNYVVLYVAVLVISVMLVSADIKVVDYQFETNFTAVLACFNNIGPGLGKVGPAENYAGYSMFSKIVLSLDMLFGRLEIMPLIILFSPATWRKK